MRAVLYTALLLSFAAAAPAQEEADAKATAPAPASPAGNKALTTDVLKSHLEQWGIRDYMYDDERRAFFFSIVQDKEEYIFHVRLFGEDGRRFLLVAARYVVEGEPPAGSARDEFFRRMAALNYQLLLARAGWDSKTQEVACDYVVPVSGGLSYQDFSMVMTGAAAAAIRTRKELRPLVVAAKQEDAPLETPDRTAAGIQEEQTSQTTGENAAKADEDDVIENAGNAADESSEDGGGAVVDLEETIVSPGTKQEGENAPDDQPVRDGR